jgi:hypothetical protein
MEANYVVLQRFSHVERVTRIEPALSAWEDFLCRRNFVNRACIGGLSTPLVTLSGLGLWPLCGPVPCTRHNH